MVLLYKYQESPGDSYFNNIQSILDKISSLTV
jgi:hypothetical protein